MGGTIWGQVTTKLSRCLHLETKNIYWLLFWTILLISNRQDHLTIRSQYCIHLFVHWAFYLWQGINLESSSATWSFSKRSTMFTCVAHQISLGGPAKWAANAPACTGSAQIGLLYGTLSFSFLPTKMTDLTMPPFFPYIFNELTNILNCFTVSTGRFSQQFSYIIQQKQTTKKKQAPA